MSEYDAEKAWRRLLWIVGEREKHRQTELPTPKMLTFEEWQATFDRKTENIGQESGGDKGG